ncbi:MAG: hypothetical protein CMM41_05120 [Rhodospirillaceae bacterium]|nr:hypothetical protein [Rhodospirillaceae bacterium]
MDLFFFDYARELFGPLFNPQKRIFVGFLLAAILIALGVQVFVYRMRPKSALAELFSIKIWLSDSAKADFKLMAVNQALFLGIAPLLISKLALATVLFETLHLIFDGRTLLWVDSTDLTIGLVFTLTVFLLDDFTKYVLHRALHRYSFLWAFHQVHHSAETLTPFTVFRAHPIEALFFTLRTILVQAVTISFFLFFFGDRADLLTILGANAFLFVFNAVGSNLRHSHIWISYGRFVERLLISPAQHQIHHSTDREHFDRNFGVALAIWDGMFGTLMLAGKKQKLKFGVVNGNQHDLSSLYFLPFTTSANVIVKILKKDSKRMVQFLKAVSRRSGFVGGVLLTVSIFGGLFFFGNALAAELNIYSHRQPFLIKPFLEAYKNKTGTKINVVYASKGLAQRLQAEGPRSPADVILTVDIARLYVYADKKLLKPVKSETLEANIPAHLRDPENRWFGFSKRARIVAVSKNARDAAGIARYEDLADPKWRGRICSRPGSHVYNRGLIASIIYTSGVAAAETWAKGVVSNLARRPQGNDRAQIKGIYEGVCDIAIINNYYFGKLKHSEKLEHRKWADSVNLIFPNQNDRGSHVNISGGGIAKYSKNYKEAVRFLEFLTSKQAQQLYGAINFEYPVNAAVPLSSELNTWGTFREHKMPILMIAKRAPEAQKVIDRVGW